MTRPALDAMSPQDVDATRWAVFARALAPTITADLEGKLTELTDIDSPPSAGTLKRRRGVIREELAQAIAQQRELRTMLLLDDDDA